MFKRFRKRATSSPYKLGLFGKLRKFLGNVQRGLVKFIWRFFTFVPPRWIQVAKSSVYHGKETVKFQDYFNPIYWVIWLVGFLYEWLASRPYLNLGPALLAIVTGLGIVGLMVKQSLEQHDWRGQYYIQIAATASASGDMELARISLINLVNRYPDNVEYKLQQAILAEKQGKTEEATRMFAALVNSRKDPMSAYWLLTHAFDLENLKGWTEQQHQEFLSVAALALEFKGEPADIVRAKMAQYLVEIGAPEEAARNLAKIASKNPEMRLTTALLYGKIGDQVRAAQWAASAADYYDAQLLKAPADSQVRMALARTFILQQQEEKAARLLAEGAKITNDKSMYDAGAEALVLWTERIAKESQDRASTIPRRIQLLQSAIRISPQSHSALDAVIGISIECRTVNDPAILQARAKLMGAVDPQIAHFIEGTIELLGGRTESAQTHFDIAAKSGTDFPGLMNNLAVTLANRKPPELDKALELANSALKHLPKHPYVLETRGQILLKQKHYQEAIVDLEAALAAKELAGPIHQSLAEAYSALGQDGQADLHRQLFTKVAKP